MPAYAVKHLASEQGPLLANLKAIRQAPHSYTSREAEATDAALGNDVYVIEIRREGAQRSCWLGYKYQAKERFRPAGGGLWKDKFKFKNAAAPGDVAVGAYFETLPQITDTAFCEWLHGQTHGMAAIPEAHAAMLDALIEDQGNGAKRFR